MAASRGDPHRAQGPGGGRAPRAPPAGDRPDPVRAPRRQPGPARGVLRAEGPGRVTVRLQLLHVPGRLDRSRRHRTGRGGGQRHEPVPPGLPLRQRWPGGGAAAGGLRSRRGRAAGRGGVAAPDRGVGLPPGWGGLPRAGAATARFSRGACHQRPSRQQLPARRGARTHRGDVPAGGGGGAARQGWPSCAAASPASCTPMRC